MTNLLHIYSQNYWHSPAYIVGDKETLLALKEAIDKALTQNQSSFESSTIDGEGYDVKVFLKESSNEEYWDNAALPYTDDVAMSPKEAIWPWKL